MFDIAERKNQMDGVMRIVEKIKSQLLQTSVPTVRYRSSRPIKILNWPVELPPIRSIVDANKKGWASPERMRYAYLPLPESITKYMNFQDEFYGWVGDPGKEEHLEEPLVIFRDGNLFFTLVPGNNPGLQPPPKIGTLSWWRIDEIDFGDDKLSDKVVFWPQRSKLTLRPTKDQKFRIPSDEFARMHKFYSSIESRQPSVIQGNQMFRDLMLILENDDGLTH